MYHGDVPVDGRWLVAALNVCGCTHHAHIICWTRKSTNPTKQLIEIANDTTRYITCLFAHTTKCSVHRFRSSIRTDHTDYTVYVNWMLEILVLVEILFTLDASRVRMSTKYIEINVHSERSWFRLENIKTKPKIWTWAIN